MRTKIIYIKKFFEIWRKNSLNEALLQSYVFLLKKIKKYRFKIKCVLYNLKPKTNKKYNTSMCKILVINHHMSVTGAPLSLKGIIKILERNNCEVDIWSFSSGECLNLFSDTNCNITFVPKKIKFNLQKNKIKTYDFVICNTIISVDYAWFCFKNKIPHLLIIHEAKLLMCCPKECDTLKEFIRQDVNNIYCVSEYAKENIFKIFNVNVNIMYNFIQEKNIKQKTLNNSNSVIFSIVGSLTQNKGIDICVKAFLKLDLKYKEKWKLYIVGRMDLENKNFWKKIKQVSSSYDNIIWTDELRGEKKWDQFCRTDVFIVPSLDESCSRIVLEAAMLGKPCIISENVGARYIVNNNAGFIIKTGDSDDLCKCILNILFKQKEDLIAIGNMANMNYKSTSTEYIYEKKLMNLVLNNIKKQTK